MRSPKSEISAPCGVEKYENGEKTIVYPSVLCSMDCAGCAWNPKEMKRRRAAGHWVEDENGKYFLFRRAK